FNASTFTSRVIASSLSDIYSAVTGAIGSLKGPLHGGANEAVMHLMLEVGEPENAKAWMLNAFKEKRKIMGFGHRVYRSGDSRVPTMTDAFKKMVDVVGTPEATKYWEMSRILDDTMVAEKGIYPNLDFPTGPAYYLMGFDIPIFTPIFVMSRITGWSAHVMEQLGDNKLIRPLSAYTGQAQREVPAIASRG
ncbi:MAG: citrate/2-methylcitrate synthase, partial [Pseudomonadota bacterium]